MQYLVLLFFLNDMVYSISQPPVTVHRSVFTLITPLLVVDMCSVLYDLTSSQYPANPSFYFRAVRR